MSPAFRRFAVASTALAAPLGLAAAALALSAALAPTAIAAAPTPAGGIPVVVGTLDFQAAEGSAEHAESMALLDTFPSAPSILYLDLAVAPAVDATNPDAVKLDFKATKAPGEAITDAHCAPGDTKFFPLAASAGELDFQTGGIHPNFLLTVDFAEAKDTPFNFLACEYAPAMAGGVVLRMAGFFVVQEIAFPTARFVRLVPYTPPYDQAQDALARSHADP